MRRRFSLFGSITGILKLVSILCFPAIVLILLYALADVPPYISWGKGQKLGLLDFEQGIPVDVRMVSGYMPDSTIFDNTGTYYGSKNFHSAQALAFRGRQKNPNIIEQAAFSDTIITQYRVFIPGDYPTENKISNPAYITDGNILTGVLRVKTDRIAWRLLLLTPLILYLSLIAFGSLQIARLLKDILAGQAFIDGSYRRIRNVGWGVVVYQLILFVFLFVSWYWSILIDFVSPGSNYRSPVHLSVRAQYDFSVYWLIGGSILLILAYAFKKGNLLQREQDLTI
jgi:hypothetical protein